MKININDYKRLWIKRQQIETIEFDTNKFNVIYPNDENSTRRGLEIMGIKQIDDYIEIEKPTELIEWIHGIDNAYIIDGIISTGTGEFGDLHDLTNINDLNISCKTTEILKQHMPELSGDDDYFDYGYGFIMEILETLIYIIDTI